MPELVTRDQHEQRLTAALAAVFARMRTAALESLAGLPWGAFQAELAAVFGDHLAEVFQEAAANMVAVYAKRRAGLTPELDRERLGEEASRWAAHYAGELASATVGNSRAGVDQLAAAEASGELSEDEKAAAVWLILGEERILDLGITEVTRAITMGEGLAVRIFAQEGPLFTVDQAPAEFRAPGVRGPVERIGGVELKGDWETRQDARVCRVCRPLHGQPPEVWQMVAPQGPPAHKRCRCRLKYRIIRGRP